MFVIMPSNCEDKSPRFEVRMSSVYIQVRQSAVQRYGPAIQIFALQTDTNEAGVVLHM